MEYYQLGGFEGAIKTSKHALYRKVYAPLQKYLRRTEGLELVLGIKPSGSSHLLLTQGEADYLQSTRNLRPSRASEFESLSPIVFHSLSELEKKLDNLEPGRNPNRDSSKLNKRFEGGDYGVERGRVENSRVLYGLLNHTVNEHKYAVGDMSWTSSIRVFSFCYNLWGIADDRSREDKQLVPKILDMGWCEAPIPDLVGEQKNSQHIKLERNHGMGIGKSVMAVYEYSDPHGPTQTCSESQATEKVREYFGRYSEPTRNPVVLVVHDWENAKHIFKFHGINVEHWDTNLNNLLRPAPILPRRQNPNDPRRRRSRSASPPRQPYNRSRRQSPPPPRLYAPVYVIDVQKMFSNISGTTDASESVPAICRRLHLFNPKGWCAGNECWMLIEAFCAMAKGRPIDDQAKEWPAKSLPAPVLVPASAPVQAVAPGHQNQTVDVDDQSDYAGSDSE
ncbi:hypothetical protein B0H11DRAFT_618654 [Mycena galericulata]|nr:hypothetical protein B0H11DRAFT_618654 [Mycena galericulata]